MTPTILASLATMLLLMFGVAALVGLGWWFETTFGEGGGE